MHTTRPLRTAFVLAALIGSSACAATAAEVSRSTNTADAAVETAPSTSTIVARSLPTTPEATTSTTPPPTTPPASTQPSTTAAPPTTSPPATSPPTTMPAVEPAQVEAVDVAAQTVFGIRIFDAIDVDAAVGDVSARLGSPTLDAGWQSMDGQSDCTGSTSFRVLWWGDFRITFERYEGDGVVRDELSAWTAGDPTLSGYVPIGDIPTASPSHIVTLEGIGLGSTRADLEDTWPNLHSSGDGRIIVIDRGGALVITLDDVDQVVGFGIGPFDCPTDEQR